MNDRIRDLVLKRTDASGIYRVAREQGMVNMFEDGIVKALAGLTSVEEVLRVTREN